MSPDVREGETARERTSGHRQDARGTDDGGEVGANVEPVFEAFDEDGESHALAIVWDEVVVCESVERGAGRA